MNIQQLKLLNCSTLMVYFNYVYTTLCILYLLSK